MATRRDPRRGRNTFLNKVVEQSGDSMRNKLRSAISASLVVAATLAAPALGFAATETGQNAMPSPTLEALASWSIGGSVLTLLDVEKNKTIGTYHARFVINGVSFSSSGRFLCIFGPSPDFPVVIVDSQRHFRVSVSQRRPGFASRYCLSAGGSTGTSPTLPADSRSDALIPVEYYTIVGGPCGTAPRYFNYVLQYWDPRGKVGRLVALTLPPRSYPV